MELIASAPGKVFVVGEYAVVGGGPAVVATVTRRLRARVRSRRGHGELVVRGDGGVVRCSLAAERVDELPREAQFVAGAALVGARLFGLRGVDIEVDTASELDPGASKTGLGGSAAAAAATLCAMYGLARDVLPGADDEHARVAAAVYAHRLVQGGGSAADVIAASVGGLVWIDGLDGRDVPHDVSDCVARVRRGNAVAFERLCLPPGLTLEVVSSGRACATGPRVARYAALAWGEDEGVAAESVRAWAAGMRVASEMFHAACRAEDPGLLLRSIRAAARLLSRLGALTGIAVFSAELRRACSVAGQLSGVAAKPSGAGGGDCAIAILPRERRTELRQLWRQAGLEPLELDLDPTGARCEVMA